MPIQTAKSAGFCFGVEHAVNTVFDLIDKEPDTEIFTLGALAHNPHLAGELEEKGVRIISEADLPAVFDRAAPGHPVTVVVRAHGIRRDLSDKLAEYAAQNPDFHPVDCTCPFVKKIHKIAQQCSAEHRSDPESAIALISGDETHPEVEGIRSYFDCRTVVFADAAALENAPEDLLLEIKGKNDVYLVSQTTQKSSEYKKSQNFLRKLYTKAKIFDTICSVTEQRQSETAELAAQSDVMLVIGGRNSSNTAKLYSISRALCERTYFVESPTDLSGIPFASHDIVGITAGASTPRGIIEEVYKTMSEEIKNEMSFEQMLDESFKTLNTGDAVKGVITSISANEIHVDIGSKVTGILSFDDITDDPTVDVRNMYHVGDTIEAIAFRVSDVDGVATLSKKRIDNINNWQAIVKAKEEGTILEGKIVETMEKGALIVVNGMKVFIPASQSGLPREADMKELAGTTQSVKIIDIDERRKRAVASIREVKRAERIAKEAEFWANVEVGKHYHGVVKSFMPYGAFVDLGGIDGMVHTSELSWRRIKHPSQVVAIGDEIDVFIKEFDQEKRRISLGYKTEESNPWTIFTNQYSVGDVANVKIVSMMPFGAFAEIVPGVDGLIHISQIADHRIATPAEVLEKGQMVDAQIVGIDEEQQQVALSIRALLTPADEEESAEEVVEEAAEATDAE